MKKYKVYLIEQAESDLEEIFRAVAINDSEVRARHVIDHLEDLCGRLAHFPERGHTPAELDGLGIADYREVHYKPYRVVYQIEGSSVYIHGIFDGRRDMRDLLARRLMGAS